MIRVVLPAHLGRLAHVAGEVALEVADPVTQASILDALEARYPMLRGTIREHVTQKRRSFLRFFACNEDVSHESPDAPLPEGEMLAIWFANDRTVLCARGENKATVPDYLPIENADGALFPATMVAWRHGKRERDLLRGLHNQGKEGLQ